jgi:molybdopterin-containing oxidoreductase family membrane subunit
LLHPFFPKGDSPEKFLHYFPTWEEWAIAIGSLAGALLIMTILVRIFPILPIRELINEKTKEST